MPAKRAIYRNDDGLLLIDEKRCMGCRYCEWASLYGALFPGFRTNMAGSRLMTLSLILKFAGELTGRYIFYAGYFSAGT